MNFILLNPDTIIKSLKSIAKYSSAVFVVWVLVIFLPDETANKIGILEIRKSFMGFWLIALVLTGSLGITSLFGLSIISISKRIDSRRQQQLLHREVVLKRLNSLAEDERT